MDKKKYILASISLNITMFGIFFLIIGLFCIDVYKLGSTNLNPNYSENSYVVIDNVSYLAKYPQAGDIVSFKQDGIKIKRIIGVPGDKIDITNGNLYINSKRVTEAYVREKYTPGEISIYVPSGYYFVLNDNREDTNDSRQGYLVSESNITGKGIIFSDDIKHYIY